MNQIKQIVENLGMTYMFEDWARANIKTDKRNINYPIFIDVLPSSGTFKINNGDLKDDTNRMFAFLDKCPLDFDSTESNQTVERMKLLAKRFIRDVSESGIYEPINSDVPYGVVFDKLDINLTGITVEFTLKPIYFECSEDL